MKSKEYQQMQKSVHRLKQRFGSLLIYHFLFFSIVAFILSYMLPVIYYRFVPREDVRYQNLPSVVMLSDYPDYLRENALEKYRYLWYEMGQQNLHYDPLNRQASLQFLGKNDLYPVLSKFGNQEQVVYTVNNRYLFDQLASAQVTSNNLDAYAFSSNMQNPDQQVNTYDGLVDYLTGLGELKQVSLAVTLKNDQSPSAVREIVGDLTVQHYSIAYQTGSVFGYTDTLVQQVTANNYDQQVLTAVQEGVAYLNDHYDAYGNLGWDFDGNIRFTSNRDNQIQLHDFQDLQDYIADNGVKVNAILVTGNATALADWLKQESSMISRVQVRQVQDVLVQQVITEGE
ncbi:hypothetical protein [Enterococcus sp. DIV0876]|uniref:hypothetical protein n=1 Tax=Enterococcus sp. DIV0876 TaxID=2774633 RepID=UPI003D2FC7BA